jgi:hypothetical protein
MARVGVDELKAAYMAGFMASGEGWNGEWPFEAKTLSDERMKEKRAQLEQQFQAWLASQDADCD